MKPTDEQLRDPKWWDENAPEGATHYDTDPNEADEPWLKVEGTTTWYWADGKWVKIDNREFFDMYKETFVARPIRLMDERCRSEWDGEGLPPVGDIVEYAFSDEIGDAGAERWKEGDEIEILAHKSFGAEAVAVAWNITQREASQRLAKWKGKAVFRPLRTKEQRERDDLASFLTDFFFDDFNETLAPEDIAGAIIAAGWRKGDS